MLYTVQTNKKTIEQAGADLEKAVTSRKFGVMTIHDLKETLNKKGVDFKPECRVYEVCNPQQAKSVLEADLAISTVLPCRISLYAEGGMVKLATLKPTVMIQMFNRPELQFVAREVERLLIEMMNEAIS